MPHLRVSLTKRTDGLIADGWSIDDTTGNDARGPLPDDALFVENVVGTLDTERASVDKSLLGVAMPPVPC